MAIIELIGNPQQHEDKKYNSFGNGEYSVWDWEYKILKQEQAHFKNHLNLLQAKIDAEIQDEIATGKSEAEAEHLAEAKFKKDKEFMLLGLKRSLDEEEIHIKQQGHSKYRNLNSYYLSLNDMDMRTLDGPTRSSEVSPNM